MRIIILVLGIIGCTPPILSQDLDFDILRNKKIDSLKYLKYDLETLRLMRNSIFAYHGYKFNAKDLREYFSKFDWYNARYSSVNNLLNNIEKENVKTIKNLEAFHKNPEKFRKQYFASIRELPKRINLSKMEAYELEEYNYFFWGVTKPIEEHVLHTCYSVYGKRTTKQGYFVFYKTYECPSAAAGIDYFNVSIVSNDGISQSKMVLAQSDGIYDFEEVIIASDTLYSTRCHFKETYWDDYENEAFDSIPYKVVRNKYFLDVFNNKIVVK